MDGINGVSESEVLMSESGVAFTRDQFLEIVADAEEKEKQAAAAKRRVSVWIDFLRTEGRSDWIPSNLVLLSQEDHRRVSGKKGKAPAERGTWTAEVLYELAELAQGATPLELRAIMLKGQMADRMKSNINGFYNALARLTEAGKVVKHRGHLFTSETYAAFKERVLKGEVADHPEELERPATMVDLTVSLIGEHPQGIEVSEIIEKMMAAGHVDNAGSIYNVMSKLNNKGLVRREGRKYFPKE
ncbi:hypothetical protein [Devosia sp.]|uniref:hypothetical protein n=1 Tax=Devosia sp. TaxID=1871048 RepID=UPI0037BE939D